MKYLKDITTVVIDNEKCTGCNNCIDVCPREVLSSSGNKKVLVDDRDSCIECGACENNCPFDAITVKSGVGCAAAYITAKLKGGDPCCGEGSGSSCCG